MYFFVFYFQTLSAKDVHKVHIKVILIFNIETDFLSCSRNDNL